jgi:hypothetical protein
MFSVQRSAAQHALVGLKMSLMLNMPCPPSNLVACKFSPGQLQRPLRGSSPTFSGPMTNFKLIPARDAVFLGQRAPLPPHRLLSFGLRAQRTHRERADKAQLMVTQISTQFNETMLNCAAKRLAREHKGFTVLCIDLLSLDLRMV